MKALFSLLTITRTEYPEQNPGESFCQLQFCWQLRSLSVFIAQPSVTTVVVISTKSLLSGC